MNKLIMKLAAIPNGGYSEKPGMDRLHRTFIYLAGSVLLALSLANLAGVSGSAQMLRLPDPLLGISLRIVMLIVGGMELTVALVCLLSRRRRLPIILVSWLLTNFTVYQAGLMSQGCHPQWGCLGNLPATLQISPNPTGLVAILVGLLLGAYVILLWPGLKNAGRFVGLIFQRRPREPSIHAEAGVALGSPSAATARPVSGGRSQAAFVRTLKISCTACGGHIEFPTNIFGERIPCPHCQATITLQKARNLKMACNTCAGHLEFPDHALGQTIPCPHCNQPITLKEPA